jgi:sterol desaturase/sphingolipid hydroxylase (fatty acid hydroxylase superfamily)
MISNRSIRVYLTLNGALIATSYLYYFVMQTNLVTLIAATIVRNVIMAKAIENNIHAKPQANADYVYPQGEFIGHVIQAAVIEATTTYIIIPLNLTPNYTTVAIAFIPMSFAFDVIFDFFFYWGHRALHHNHSPWHKIHHTHIHLKPTLTFYQDPVDILLTVAFPFFAAARIIQIFYPLCSFEIALLATYKIFIELSGHSGRVSSPSPSFTQFIWLPRALDIELYSEDHNLHHSSPTHNFSKQFSLWDKVFGTFKKAKIKSE